MHNESIAVLSEAKEVDVPKIATLKKLPDVPSITIDPKYPQLHHEDVLQMRKMINEIIEKAFK